MTETEFIEELLTKLRNIPRFHWAPDGLEYKGKDSGGNFVVYRDIADILYWVEAFRPHLNKEQYELDKD